MGWKVRYSEEQVTDAVVSSRSLSDALRKLGLRAAGHNYRTLHKLIDRYQIPTDHLDPNWYRRAEHPRQKTPLSEVLVRDSNYGRDKLKRRLYDEGLKQRRCELCGQDETWNGRRIALILDHVNGVATDNRLENLRIVCPNCNAALDTHCGRQNRVTLTPRFCLHCGAEFMPRYPSNRYCSHPCGAHYPRRKHAFPELRKVKRPPYEQLIAELAATNYCAVARKYGVSDNAVRKWVSWYEAERARAAEQAALSSG